MDLSALDLAAAGGIAVISGGVNALAGGGTLLSFPTLVGLGVPAVEANVTNTVSLLPGYLSGSWAQRDDLRPRLAEARAMAAVSGIGGLAGSVLLLAIPGRDFRVAVPYLIVGSCALLLFQDRIREAARLPPMRTADPEALPGGGPASDGLPREQAEEVAGKHRVLLLSLVLIAAVYGGFFGAGLGIMLLAVLGLFDHEPLARTNALKQALSFIINLVAAVFFAFSGHVVWVLVPVMAAGSLLGGLLGSRLVPVIPERGLRRLVIVAGLAVAASFWAT